MKLGDNARWQIDRRVPLALVITIVMQTGAGLIWAGSAAERLTNLETRASRIDEMVERTARLEEQGKAMRGALERIEGKLDGVVAGK